MAEHIKQQPLRMFINEILEQFEIACTKGMCTLVSSCLSGELI